MSNRSLFINHLLPLRSCRGRDGRFGVDRTFDSWSQTCVRVISVFCCSGMKTGSVEFRGSSAIFHQQTASFNVTTQMQLVRPLWDAGGGVLVFNIRQGSFLKTEDFSDVAMRSSRLYHKGKNSKRAQCRSVLLLTTLFDFYSSAATEGLRFSRPSVRNHTAGGK